MSGYPVQVDSLPPSSDFHPLVYPTIGGIPCGQLRADSATGTITLVRAAIMPGDDVTAAFRIAKGFPDVRNVYPDSSMSIRLPAGMSSVYLLLVGDGGTDAGADGVVDSSAVVNINGGATVGTVAMHGITEAQILAGANAIRLDFASADIARIVTISCGPTFDSGTQMYIEIEGVSYA